MIRKSWNSWYIRKLKDAYLVLLCGKLIENLLTRMKLKTLQTLWMLNYLRFFWNYLDINYVFQSNVTCEFYVVLTPSHVWFPGDNGIKSNSVPFHLGWHVLPYYPWGEEIPWLCVGEATVHGAKRPHAKEVLFDVLSLLPMGGEKNLEGIGKAIVHGATSLHTREDNIMPVVNGWIPWPIYVLVWYICDDLPYVRYYGFRNYIVSAHKFCSFKVLLLLKMELAFPPPLLIMLFIGLCLILLFYKLFRVGNNLLR